VSAPAGVCVSCGRLLQWTFIDGLLYVRCRICYDLFGMDVAGEGTRGRREAGEAGDSSKVSCG